MSSEKFRITIERKDGEQFHVFHAMHNSISDAGKILGVVRMYPDPNKPGLMIATDFIEQAENIFFAMKGDKIILEIEDDKPEAP